MTTQALNWTLNLERGTVYFGKPLPFAGNTYRIILDGGKVDGLYVIYLMSDDGVECLAKSKYDGVNYHIAFNTAALRDAFVREPHEARTFHCYVRNAEYLGPDDLKEGSTVAEGDLTIVWNPLWTEAATGKAYTMKGEPGKPGSPGGKGDKGDDGASAYELAKKAGFGGSEDEWLASLRGAPGSSRVIPLLNADGNESGVWHKLYVQVGDNGKLRLVVDTTPVDDPRQDSLFVSLEGDISIFGTKTFLSSPVVPTIAGADGEVDVADDSQKAVNTKWIRAWWGSIWKGIKAAAQTFSAECTFLSGIIGNVKGNLEGTADKAIADKNGKKIHETYLPRTGGTMSGSISANMEEFSISAVDNKRTVRISGGTGLTTGASFVARGKDNPSYPGEFVCRAVSEEKSVSLLGKPSGTLTWDGKEVLRSNSSSSWRIIELGDDYVMMWLYSNKGTNSGTQTFTLPIPMKNTSYSVFTAINGIGGGYNEKFEITTRTSTNFTLNSPSDGWTGFIVVGKKA